MTTKEEITMNNGPQLTKQVDELTVDELAQVSGGKPSAPPKKRLISHTNSQRRQSQITHLNNERREKMSTGNLKQQPKPSADFLNKSNTELTEEELRRVSGGLSCCAGAHYNALGSPEELQVRK